MSLFSRFKKDKKKEPFITVVSGLPRSGTSMMMQILQAGGLPVLTDAVRSADHDNPKGYYEFERVKKLKEGDIAWLPEAQGKVVKVVSPLLEHLPASYRYKVVFMQREMAEILASQKQMLTNLGEPTNRVSDKDLTDFFRQHLSKVQTWLAGQKNIEVLYIQYSGLLSDPEGAIQALLQFLDLPLQMDAMRAVPDQKLHRQRK